MARRSGVRTDPGATSRAPDPAAGTGREGPGLPGIRAVSSREFRSAGGATPADPRPAARAIALRQRASSGAIVLACLHALPALRIELAHQFPQHLAPTARQILEAVQRAPAVADQRAAILGLH